MCEDMLKRILALTCMLALMMPAWAGGHKDDGPVVAAYVTGWNEFKELPDCSVLTHINYAFGNVNKTYDGVTIQHPERLRQLVELKKDHKIYIVLSIGGWTAGGFSEMASTERRRKAFARDCKRIGKAYHLDGIDMDWEYIKFAVLLRTRSAKSKHDVNTIRRMPGGFLTFAVLKKKSTLL